MKFYLFAREDYCELSPEGLQDDEIKFTPSHCEKVLLKIDDPEFSPEDFKDGGKYLQHVADVGATIVSRFPINPYTMGILRETGGEEFLQTDASGKMYFFSFFKDNVTVLENMDDDQAILYYELN